MKSHLRPAPEPLEARIAPAVFFLDATTKNVVDAAGNSVNNATAQTLADSDIAVLLAKGDSLVLDLDGDHVKDAGESTLVSVTGGKAMVFARDVDADGGFDLGELTGIAAGNGFKATLGTDIRGPIATTLLDDGTVGDLAELGTRSIAGITSTGVVFGIFAGGAISNVKLGTGVSAQDASVGSIGAGTGGAGFTMSYAGNATSFVSTHTPAPGVAGPSIKNLTLPSGFTAIYAGAGGDSAAGGSVSNVAVAHTTGASIIAAGAGGTSAAGSGGKGGSVSAVSFVASPAGTGTVTVAAGSGGDGVKNGGAGGAISGVSVDVLSLVEGIAFSAGNGGAGGTGAGGAGGAVKTSTLRTAAGVGFVFMGTLTPGTISVFAGLGGASATGTGGLGGSISATTIEALDPGARITEVLIGAGTGGASTSGRGGAGGGLTGLDVSIDSVIGHTASMMLYGGFTATAGGGGAGATAGGAGGAISASVFATKGAPEFLFAAGSGGNATASGKGGAGGGITATRINTGAAAGAFDVFAGSGGDGPAGGGKGGALDFVTARSNGSEQGRVAAGFGGAGTGTGSGGAGGAITKLIAAFGSTVQGASVTAGGGGPSNAASGAGGAGGKIDAADVTTGDVTGVDADVTVSGGSGGNAGATGKGGAGGPVSRVLLTVNGDVDDSVRVFAGSSGESHNAAGAKGGNLSNVGVTNNGFIGTGVYIYAGKPLAPTGAGSLSGGHAGTLSDVTWNNLGGTDTADASFINTYGGAPGLGSGKGGNGGSLSRVTINSIGEHGYIGIGDFQGGGAGGAGGGNGGNGGTVNTVTINDSAGGPEGSRIEIYGAKGGAGGGANGRGGNSGSVSIVALNAPDSIFRIYTNEGGDAASKGGNSGAVSNITGIARELRIDTGRGGDATAGSGGNAGKISNINVTAVDLVRRIVGGRGGYGTTVAGFGGSISGVTVIGDIGDFGSAFGWDFATGMGGISPGIGGNLVAVTDTAKTGSVTNVTATRIAAIVAGAPANNAIVAANAVTKITGLTTSVLGADVNGDGVFDFTDAGAAGFNPADADTATDGFVLVKTGGFAVLPVQPLKLVFV